jgi:hypothetical protein
MVDNSSMNPNDFITENENINEAKSKALQDRADAKKHEIELAQVLDSVSRVGADVTTAIRNKSNKVSVDNFPKSISTPDVERLVVEIKALKDEVMSQSPEDKTAHKLLGDLQKAVSAIKIEIPKPDKFPDEINVKNQKDYSQKIDDVIQAVQAIQVNVEPNITVKPTDVKVNTDFTTLEKKLDLVTRAVKAISIIVPEQDDSKILDRLSGVTKAINSLSFPVPNYILPFKDADGVATQAQLTTDGRLSVSPIEEKPHNIYTWSDGLLTEKAAIYNDRTETTTYTWVDGLLNDKITVTT